MDSPDVRGDNLVVEAAQYPVVVCDAVESLAIHNSVARLKLSRLTAEGASAPALELLMPCAVVAQIVKALESVQV